MIFFINTKRVYWITSYGPILIEEIKCFICVVWHVWKMFLSPSNWKIKIDFYDYCRRPIYYGVVWKRSTDPQLTAMRWYTMRRDDTSPLQSDVIVISYYLSLFDDNQTECTIIRNVDIGATWWTTHSVVKWPTRDRDIPNE